jgi:DNA-binding phage protein
MKTPNTRTKSRSAIVSDQLRTIVDRSDLSIYRIEREAGLARGALLRFVSGETSLKLESVDRLSAVLGLRLIEVERRQPSKVGNRRARPVKPGPDQRVEQRAQQLEQPADPELGDDHGTLLDT